MAAAVSDLAGVARWLAAVACARRVAVALHELSHLAAASALGHSASIQLDGKQPSVAVSKLSLHEDQIIRHAGWIASLVLACACSVVATPLCRALSSEAELVGMAEMRAVTLAFVLVALEAMHSDLLTSKTTRGRFLCGNFGLLLLSQANADHVDRLLVSHAGRAASTHTARAQQ